MSIRCLVFLATLAAVVHAEDWPQWRGPRGDGRSSEASFPVNWSKLDNVIWRTPLPGGGHASPIVFGGRVFTVAANPETQERLLLCVDRGTGKLLWQQTERSKPRVAVVVSKKVHKSAVVRNRIRRRIYEYMREVLQNNTAMDFVFIVQDTAPAEISHEQLVAEVSGLLQKTPIQQG